MLKGISPYISPELLAVLAEMGHGDELVLADANFPGATVAKRLLRADGISVSVMLAAIMPLFALDTYAEPLTMMQVVSGDEVDPAVEADFMRVIARHDKDAPQPVRIERFAFYERARDAFAVLMTGEARKYGNLILRKGVILPPASSG